MIQVVKYNNISELFSRLVWFSVSLTVVLSLLVPNGYSIGAALVFLLSLSTPLLRSSVKIDKYDLIFIFSFLFYSLGMLLLVYSHELTLRGLDKPSRFLLVISPLILLLKINFQKNALFLSFIIGSFGSLLVALYDRIILGLVRSGGDHNPIMFGGVAVLLSVICLNYALYYYNKRDKLLFLVSLVASFSGFFASILSGSKGGWLVFPVAFAFLFWNYRENLGKKFYVNSLIISIFLIAIISITPSLGVSERVKTLFVDIKLVLEGDTQETSVSHRTELWKASVFMFKDSPVFGVGKSGQISFKENLVSQGSSHKSILKFTHAHNEYLNELSLRGGVGLCLLLIIYLTPLSLFMFKFKQCSNNYRVKVFALAGSLVPISYMVLGLTQSMFTHNIGVIMYAFPIVFFWAATRWAEREERELGNIA